MNRDEIQTRQELNNERGEILSNLESWLEVPMIVLVSFGWRY